MRLLALLTLFTASLYGEISSVTLNFSGACDESCGELLQKRLEDIEGVAIASVDSGANQANLSWKPDEPFSYRDINVAMRRVGPSLRQIRVEVRGTIKSSGSQYKLISLGDKTSFTLYGPIDVEAKNPVRESTRNRPLSEETKEQLKAAEKLSRIVTIKGPLLRPNVPPLNLIIESISLGDQGRPD